MTETNYGKDQGRATALLGLLTKQYELLVAAKCDESILKEFSALLRSLRNAKVSEHKGIFESGTSSARGRQRLPQVSDETIARMSLGDVEKLLDDDTTPRKLLERVAILRFRVPKGSMRSFANRRMLIDKLAALVGNEQAHTTIETVARR